MSRFFLCGPLAACLLAGSGAHAADATLDEILVTAGPRVPAAQLPVSVTRLDATTLRAAGVQHFEDVLGSVPDLNWAAGTSRPRFFQLRGIGEVEQYQGAPNPSVGFLIDDIDFSGVGMPATLFDTAGVEVLRGPQGTTYGANALAGLISVRTADAGSGPELTGELTGGSYSTRAAGVVVGDGFASGAAGWRLVAQRYESDGFRHNAYLGRNATNGYDETTLRGKLRVEPRAGLRIDLTLMDVNLNNGYDAWSIDNTTTTYSNQPGRDSQHSRGASLRVAATVDGVGTLHSVTSAADSAILYSFDGDWGNDVRWGAYAPYDYFQADHRQRRTIAQDLRLVSDPASWSGRAHWLVGAYALRLSESDRLDYVYDDQAEGAGTSTLTSEYRADSVALYGAGDVSLAGAGTLGFGLRVEERDARYRDSADVATPFPDARSRMIGGNASWTKPLGESVVAYVTGARGYKGGGFNIGSQVLAEQRSFGPESLWSLEAGIKQATADQRLAWSAAAFYMRRQHMQVYLSEQLQQNNPLAYVFYTQNASDGLNAGLEGELRYRLAPGWRLDGSASLLRTRYQDLVGVFATLGLDGRAQPFAPAYKASMAIEYERPDGGFARIDSMVQGSFYYYTNTAQTAAAYAIENLRVGYRRHGISASLWVRNLLDARYAQQGFYFGLIPPNFPNQSFLQQGDPRQVGITISAGLGASRD